MRPIKIIYYSSHFAKALGKLPNQMQKEVGKRESIFRRDCFDPRLKTHKLKGKNRELWSFSISYQHRIVFKFIINNSVLFIDVGDHAIYQ